MSLRLLGLYADMDLRSEDPVTGAYVDPSDVDGSAKSIATGVGGIVLGAGIVSTGIMLYKRFSEATGDATAEWVMD